MIDIFSLSVEELALKIKDAQITSVEVCEKYIERIDKFDQIYLFFRYTFRKLQLK